MFALCLDEVSREWFIEGVRVGDDNRPCLIIGRVSEDRMVLTYVGLAQRKHVEIVEEEPALGIHVSIQSRCLRGRVGQIQQRRGLASVGKPNNPCRKEGDAKNCDG